MQIDRRDSALLLTWKPIIVWKRQASSQEPRASTQRSATHQLQVNGIRLVIGFERHTQEGHRSAIDESGHARAVRATRLVSSGRLAMPAAEEKDTRSVA